MSELALPVDASVQAHKGSDTGTAALLHAQRRRRGRTLLVGTHCSAAPSRVNSVRRQDACTRHLMPTVSASTCTAQPLEHSDAFDATQLCLHGSAFSCERNLVTCQSRTSARARQSQEVGQTDAHKRDTHAERQKFLKTIIRPRAPTQPLIST